MEQATINKPRAVLLYRASSKKQTDSENDIPLQRNILKPWCEQKGWEFVTEKVEGGVSGYRISADDRDKIQEIKRMADRREFDILGIYMSDRLGRIAQETPLIVSYLNARGIKVVSYCEGEINSESHSDKLMTYIRYWQAEGESIKTATRVSDAILDNVNRGRWRGGKAPYGYRHVSRGTLNYKGKPILDTEPDPVTSKHVRTIFRLYTEEHYGTHLIAKYLNDNDIPTMTGNLWTSGLVSNVLKCKTYTGVYTLHKVVKSKPKVESPLMPHLIILDNETWLRAQEIRKANTAPRRAPTRRGSLLLTGLLYCGQCGQKVTSFYSYSKADYEKPIDERTRRYYYRCVSIERPKSNVPKCSPSMWSAQLLEEQVLRHVKQFVREIDRDRLVESHENDAKSRIEEATKRADKAEADMEKNAKEVKKLKEEIMKALLGESTFPQETLGAMLKAKETEGLELAERYDQAQKRILELDQELAAEKFLREKYNDWESRFDRATEPEKKAMLINIIDRITIKGDEVHIDFKVELAPSTGLKEPETERKPNKLGSNAINYDCNGVQYLRSNIPKGDDECQEPAPEPNTSPSSKQPSMSAVNSSSQSYEYEFTARKRWCFAMKTGINRAIDLGNAHGYKE